MSSNLLYTPEIGTSIDQVAHRALILSLTERRGVFFKMGLTQERSGESP